MRTIRKTSETLVDITLEIGRHKCSTLKIAKKLEVIADLTIRKEEIEAYKFNDGNILWMIYSNEEYHWIYKLQVKKEFKHEMIHEGNNKYYRKSGDIDEIEPYIKAVRKYKKQSKSKR